eukprot:scaffold124517_cov31-Tisochrysis_lutea.AAC.5
MERVASSSLASNWQIQMARPLVSPLNGVPQVAPHLFDPMGTTDPNADWIGIEPDIGNGNRKQCYCYRCHALLSEPTASASNLMLWHA